MNFFTFLSKQKNEDWRSFIIHFPGNSGKTHFVRRLSESQKGIVYIDLLEVLSTKKDLQIKKFNLKALQKYLLEYAYPINTHSVIVDQMDFLLNTWDEDEKRSFVQWLKIPLRSPALTDITFVFVIQTDKTIVQQELKNSLNESRIIMLNEFDAIQ